MVDVHLLVYLHAPRDRDEGDRVQLFSTIAVRFKIKLLAETPFSCTVCGNNNKWKTILKRVSQKWVMQELTAIALDEVQWQASVNKVLGMKPPTAAQNCPMRS